MRIVRGFIGRNNCGTKLHFFCYYNTLRLYYLHHFAFLGRIAFARPKRTLSLQSKANKVRAACKEFPKSVVLYKLFSSLDALRRLLLQELCHQRWRNY